MGGTDPADALETSIPTDGGRLHVRAVGDGAPIIVIHGGPAFDHSYFLPDLDRLADLGRLVYYDERGRGRSSPEARAEDISIESEVADLDAVRSWSGSERAALLGHSWGTLVALEYAIRHPERVSHLILLNPAPASHAGELRMRAHFNAIRSPEDQARLAELRADPAFLAGDIATEAAYLRLHFAATVTDTAVLDDLVARIRRQFRPEGVVRARAIGDRLEALSWDRDDYDLLPQLRALRMPALVISSDREFIPIDIAREIAAALPNSRFEVIPDCGHFSFIDRPDAVHALVSDTLSRPE
jgi:proline iminopeptidase